MLDLRLNLNDIDVHCWDWAGDHWHCGSSWAKPFRNPAIEYRAVTDGRRTALACLAVTGGGGNTNPMPVRVNADAFEETIQRLTDHRDDWVLLETSVSESARITTGVACTAPLYFAVGDGELRASWDLTALHGVYHRSALDLVEITRRLSLRHRYSSATFWEGVQQLTERATVRFSRTGQVSINLPEPSSHALARTSDADPVPAFRRILAAVLEEGPRQGGSTAIHLSGGLDSTVVALALGEFGDSEGALAAGIILDADRGRQQTERRREIIQQIGSNWWDVTVPLTRFPPFGPSSRFSQRMMPLSPYTDLYADAFEHLADLMVSHGITTVYTGVGGDELVTMTAEEVGASPDSVPRIPIPVWLGRAAREALDAIDRDCAPTTVVPESALIAKACVAAPLLRRGIWPMHPLAHPALVRFTEWLPAGWRTDKALMRATIRAYGLGEQIVRPAIPENFGPFIRQAMREYAPLRIRRMLAEDSPLLDAGLLDAAELLAVAERLETGRDVRADREVVFALVADRVLTDGV